MPSRADKQPQNLLQAILIPALLLSLVAIALLHARPPAPLDASAPASLFSAARAMSTVAQIARRPHPLASAENAAVRQYLLAELTALGLHPQVQTAIGVNPAAASAGWVHNVSARLPGTSSDKALLLVAHYDSTHTGPGAADNAASVAAILETLRALKSLPSLTNDVICLFTDGEEAGLLGAAAFVAEHPWAKQVGLVLNFEYRGNSGPFLMFQTSAGNGKLIAGLARAAPQAIANSLMYEVYKRLPNDTDLTIFNASGIPGMNFAAIEGHTHYHTQLDRPELLNPASLQHQGNILLALTRYFGKQPLQQLNAADMVYFDIAGPGLLHYPVSWVLPLTGLQGALFVLVCFLGRKRQQLRMTCIAGAIFAHLLMLLLVAGCGQLLWLGIRALHPEYKRLLQGSTYNSHCYLLAFTCLGLGLYSAMSAGFQRWIRPLELTVGAMICWLTALMLTSVLLPGASFLFFGPLLSLTLALGYFFWRQRPAAHASNPWLLFLLASAPGILLAAPLLKLLFVALTPGQIGIVLVLLVLELGLLTPLLSLLPPQAPAVEASIGTVFLLIASATAGFDGNKPLPNYLQYLEDADQNKAYWLSKDEQLDAWTGTFFAEQQAKRPTNKLLDHHAPPYWVSGAPLLPLPAPRLEILQDTVAGNRRHLSVRLISPRAAPRLDLSITGTTVFATRIAGHAYSQTATDNWQVRVFGLPEQGATLDWDLAANAEFSLRIQDIDYGLPDFAPPRPNNMMPQPFGLSDTSMVSKNFRFGLDAPQKQY